MCGQRLMCCYLNHLGGIAEPREGMQNKPYIRWYLGGIIFLLCIGMMF